MLQTTLSVPLDVKPESAPKLESLLETFKQTEDDDHGVTDENFGRLIQGIPSLHFMSMSIFWDGAYDPTFIIEVNCDGAAGPFWAHLDALAGETIREMVRCCKRPLDHRNGELYDAVTSKDTTISVVPYLEAMTQRPSVFHHGNRGLSRDRILKEAALFRAVRGELDTAQNGSYFGLEPLQIHERLRARVTADFPWLDVEAPPRITTWEAFVDGFKLIAFATLIMFAFALPGLIASLLLPTSYYLALVAVLTAGILYLLIKLHAPLPGTEVKTTFSLTRNLRFNLRLVLLILFGAVLGLALPALAATWLASLLFDIGSFAEWWWPVTATVALGVLSLTVTLPGVVLWLRWLELHDSSQYMANIDAAKVAAMARREDWVSQNHMGSIVHIRPGVLRTIIIKAGHCGLGLVLRVAAKDGYLGSMRTVHFGHWAFLNNSSRLLFFSNYDQSWGAYLDDFIEKAHGGLTLAWGCGVGFPPTRFLIYDGASHGRLFKNWALASRTVSRFWCSAYPDLSVDQIERNYRLAEGLRQKSLSSAQASEWVRDL